jgi:HK97 gp10 family phage protein
MSVETYLECEGAEELSNKLQQLDAHLKSRIQTNLADFAGSIGNTAKQLAPIRTGHLRSTIYAEIGDWTAKVGSTAPYAAYLEFGTRKIRAQRFLARAVETHVPRLDETMDNAIETAVAEAGRE